MARKKYTIDPYPPTGSTGADFEDEFGLEEDIARIDERWPVSSLGNKESLGNITCETMEELPPGYIEVDEGLDIPQDPPVSEAQRRAMYSAAEGHSKLGIPKSVGKEFVEAGHGITGLPERKGKK